MCEPTDLVVTLGQWKHGDPLHAELVSKNASELKTLIKRVRKLTDCAAEVSVDGDCLYIDILPKELKCEVHIVIRLDEERIRDHGELNEC
jgi:hypothetical protein